MGVINICKDSPEVLEPKRITKSITECARLLSDSRYSYEGFQLEKKQLKEAVSIIRHSLMALLTQSSNGIYIHQDSFLTFETDTLKHWSVKDGTFFCTLNSSALTHKEKRN